MSNHTISLPALKVIGANGAESEAEGCITLDDFYSNLPEGNYIYVPTRAQWPAKSVDAAFTIIRGGKVSTWLDENRPIHQMVWSPGDPEVIEGRVLGDGGWFSHPGHRTFNTYQPPVIVPGDASAAGPWIDHVRRIYPRDADHIIQWMAHRVQHPDVKINHALVLGGQQGIGKDALLQPVREAIGPWNMGEASPLDIFGDWNDFIRSVILLISEAKDLGDTKRYQFYEHMKTYTASPPYVLPLKKKWIRNQLMMNICGVVFTTNYENDALYIPEDDRRYYIASSEWNKGDFSKDYWKDLFGWFNDGGNEAVAAYLSEFDLSEFDPKAEPNKTEAWWSMVDMGVSPEKEKLVELLDKMGNPDVVTIKGLLATASLYFHDFLWNTKNTRQHKRLLSEVGYMRFLNDGAKDRLWRVEGKRQAVYVKRSLSHEDRIAAVMRIVGQ